MQSAAFILWLVFLEQPSMDHPRLGRLRIYPFKALDACEPDCIAIAPGGSLAWDRQYALQDADGRFLNGKRSEKIHALRSSFDLEKKTITLWTAQHTEKKTFEIVSGFIELEKYFSEFLGQYVKIVRNEALGFPDDSEAFGPTIISSATLETVASWFPGVTVENVRRRFRANLELDGVEPFWEDRLYGESGRTVAFHIGSVLFHGVNPCQRCIVPTRDPETAQRFPDFQKIFQEKRRATLPAWANPERFDHFYRLAVNTRTGAGQAGKMIHVGDAVRVD